MSLTTEKISLYNKYLLGVIRENQMEYLIVCIVGIVIHECVKRRWRDYARGIDKIFAKLLPKKRNK